jgi:hypothetical protein
VLHHVRTVIADRALNLTDLCHSGRARPTPYVRSLDSTMQPGLEQTCFGFCLRSLSLSSFSVSENFRILRYMTSAARSEGMLFSHSSISVAYIHPFSAAVDCRRDAYNHGHVHERAAVNRWRAPSFLQSVLPLTYFRSAPCDEMFLGLGWRVSSPE